MKNFRFALPLAFSAAYLLLGCASTPSDPTSRTWSTKYYDKESPDFHIIGEDRIKVRPDYMKRYPSSAQDFGKEANVALHCILQTDGALHECRVFWIESVGHEFDSAFAGATLDAAKGFRYTPLVQNGAPLERESVQVGIAWRLR